MGIYTTGGANFDDYKLDLHNVQIYNSSNFGILSLSSSVNAENLVINKSGQSSFAGTYGGKYKLNHCTISNYWNSGIRQFPSLLLNNFYIDSEENEFVNDLFEVDISNSIIYGNQNIEFLIEKLGDSDLNYKLTNTLLKFNDINNYFENDPIYEFSNDLIYENIFKNLSPGFINAQENDLRINQNSEIIGLGLQEYAIQTPLDILNNNRTINPDLGAYQHIIIQD